LKVCMYRLTRKAARVRRFAREEVPPEDRRTSRELPMLRRRLIVIDYDSGEPQMHVVDLYRTRRVDSYRAVVDGREWKRAGWSLVLDGLRRAMPRMLSERAMQ
jgi:hypothetical protein